MGLADTAAKEYISEPDVFADVFNYGIGREKQLIEPDQLKELDTTSISIPYEKGKKNKLQLYPIQREQDVLKVAALKTDGKLQYLILSSEIQMNVHYAMPVRVMENHSFCYSNQVQHFKAKHRKENDLKDSAEFLSGMTKTDRIYPMITAVVNLGKKPWERPVHLTDMMDEYPDDFKPYLNNYSFILIDPMRMDEKDFELFRSSLGKVLHLVKYQNDGKMLKNLLDSDKAYQEMPINAAIAMKAIIHIDIPIDSKEGKKMGTVNVCKAVQDLMDDARKEEKRRADQEKLRADQATQRADQAEKNMRESARKLLNMGLTAEQVAVVLNFSVDEVRSLG